MIAMLLCLQQIAHKLYENDEKLEDESSGSHWVFYREARALACCDWLYPSNSSPEDALLVKEETSPLPCKQNNSAFDNNESGTTAREGSKAHSQERRRRRQYRSPWQERTKTHHR